MKDLPGVSHGGDGTVVLDKIRGKRLSAAERPGLVLIPSSVVSPHLYLADEPSLHQAGLAHRDRSGRSVLYRLDLTAVDALGTDLSQVLLR